MRTDPGPRSRSHCTGSSEQAPPQVRLRPRSWDTPRTGGPVTSEGSACPYGPGYRVYHLQDGDNLVLLLCAGDKSSQQADIDRAHQLAGEWHLEEGADGHQG